MQEFIAISIICISKAYEFLTVHSHEVDLVFYMSYTSISFISSCFVKISSLTLITFPCFTFQPSSHFLFIEGLFALAELNIEQFIFLTQTLNIWKPTREYSEAHLHICAVKEGAHGLKICLIMRSNNQFLGSFAQTIYSTSFSTSCYLWSTRF